MSELSHMESILDNPISNASDPRPYFEEAAEHIQGHVKEIFKDMCKITKKIYTTQISKAPEALEKVSKVTGSLANYASFGGGMLGTVGNDMATNKAAIMANEAAFNQRSNGYRKMGKFLSVVAIGGVAISVATEVAARYIRHRQYTSQRDAGNNQEN